MVRPKPNSLDVPWVAGDPCPCSSGSTYGECCLQPDGLPLLSLPMLSPSGNQTGYSHSKCFMNNSHDCSKKISREHYLSKNILAQFDEFQARGLPWQEEGAEERFGINSLTAKILCTRHNSAMSPIDAAAGHAFRQITNAAIYTTKKSLAKKPSFYLISGDAFELWGIKTLLGMYKAKVASSEKKAIVEDFELDFTATCSALSGMGLPIPLGLYVHPSRGGAVQQAIGMAPLTSKPSGVVGGLRVNMLGLDFDFLIDQRGGNPQFFKERKFYRPWVLDLTGPKRTSRIIFTWEHHRNEATRVNIEIDLPYRKPRI